MEARRKTTSYERSLTSEAVVAAARGAAQSLTSSLSMRGNFRREAMAWAKVLLPVPGCPFIAITILLLSSISSPIFLTFNFIHFVDNANFIILKPLFEN